MWVYYSRYCSIVCCCCLVTKLYLTFCDSMKCSPPGSSLHRISHSRILEPFLSPANLPDPGIAPTSPAWQVDSLVLSHLGSPISLFIFMSILKCLDCFSFIISVKIKLSSSFIFTSQNCFGCSSSLPIINFIINSSISIKYHDIILIETALTI